MQSCAISYHQKAAANRLCYLFLIFLTGCLVGWIYEEIFYWITEGLLQNRGILYGPWLPIYGIGALGIYALKPTGEKLYRKIPGGAIHAVCLVLTALFLTDCILSSLFRTPIPY